MSDTTVSVADLTTSLEEATVKLSAAEAKQNAEGPALFKSGDYDGLSALNSPVKSAKADIDRITRRIADATKESRWASFNAERAPVQAVLNEIVKAKPSAPLLSVKGRILIDDVEEQQGDATVIVRRAMVTLTPTFEKSDLDAFEMMIAEGIDVAAWDAAGIADVTLSITKLGASDFNASNDVRVSPTSSLNQAGKSTAIEGTRSGGLEYLFNGAWLGTREFLEAVEASADTNAQAWCAKNTDGLERALRGDGNAMSNKGKAAAKQLGVESRAKAKAE